MSLMKGARVTWLGHATVLIQTAKGTNLLIDPFISQNPKYPKDFHLPAKLDGILLTHGHGDHIADAAPVAAKHNSPVVAIYELANYMSQKGVAQVMPMNLGGTVQVGEVAITMVEARHSSSAEMENGNYYTGVAAGYVMAIDGGPVLYHSGDTGVFGDMKLIRELYQPDVAMLSIGGNYTMGCKEAALAARLLEPKTILPIHFGTFPELRGTPQALAALVDPSVEVVAWSPGDTI